VPAPRPKLALMAVLALAGCGGDPGSAGQTNPKETLVPLTVGPGAAFRPGPFGTAAAGREPIDGMACARRPARRDGVHLELFARRHVVLVPAGIGVAPPRRRTGARVLGGRCWYPLATTDPSGLIEIERGRRTTLGAFFDVWGRPLSRTRVLSFRGRLLAFVDGRRWRADPRQIPLARHRQVVLEVGGYVPPHRVYAYPPGL
jgi:hypothetical protein